MNVFSVCFVIAWTCVACDGVFGHAHLLPWELERSERSIVKRFADGLRCSVVNERTETIIKTKESLAAGAVFLSSPGVDSRESCLSECCTTKSCNTAVVKRKAETFGCYLFDCGDPSLCSFSPHSGYSVINLVTTASSNVDKHADDLANLALITTSTVRPAVVSTAVEILRPLYAVCESTNNCVSRQQLECLNGYCVCQQGFHPVATSCRADCSRFQFECVNSDDPSLSECIAVYDRCNGISQCQDGSDELQCGEVSPTITKPPAVGPEVKPGVGPGVRPAKAKDEPVSGPRVQPAVEALYETSHELVAPPGERHGMKPANNRPVNVSQDEDLTMASVSRLRQQDNGAVGSKTRQSFRDWKDETFAGTDGRKQVDIDNKELSRQGHSQIQPVEGTGREAVKEAGFEEGNGKMVNNRDYGRPGTMKKENEEQAARTESDERKSPVDRMVEPRGRSQEQNGGGQVVDDVKGKLILSGMVDDEGHGGKVGGRFSGSGKEKIRLVDNDGDNSRQKPSADEQEGMVTVGGREEMAGNWQKYRQGLSRAEPHNTVDKNHRTSGNTERITKIKDHGGYVDEPVEKQSSLEQQGHWGHGKTFQQDEGQKLEQQNSDRYQHRPDFTASGNNPSRLRGKVPVADDVDESVKSSPGSRPRGSSATVIDTGTDGSEDETVYQPRGRSHSYPDTDKPLVINPLNIPRSEKMGSDIGYPPRDQISPDTGGSSKDSTGELSSRARLVDGSKTDSSRGYPSRERVLDSTKDTSGYSQGRYDGYNRYSDNRYGDSRYGDETSVGRLHNGQYDDVSRSSRPVAIDNRPVAVDDQPPAVYDAGPPADAGRYYSDGRDPSVASEPGRYYGDGRDLYSDVVYSPGDYYYNVPASVHSFTANNAGSPADYDFYNNDDTGSKLRRSRLKPTRNNATTLLSGNRSRGIGVNKMSRQQLANRLKLDESLLQTTTTPTTTTTTATTTATTTTTTTERPATTPSTATRLQSTSSPHLSSPPSSLPAAVPTSKPMSPRHPTRHPSHATFQALTAEDRSEMFWSTPGVRGAVVALSLGITMTVVLLIYAVCRYRRLKKVSRRRRAPGAEPSNDADYLVNGMYL